MSASLSILSSVGLVFYLLSFSKHWIENGKRNMIPPQADHCGTSFVHNKIERNQRVISIAKIIGGQETLPKKYPWLVSLRVKRLISFHVCGGSLIYENIVITAAHCVANFKPEQLAVAVGLEHANESLNASNLYNVSKIETHYLFSRFFNNDDIALIRLSKNVKFSDRVSTICLPNLKASQTSDIFGQSAITIGWGSIDGSKSAKSQPNKLQQTKLEIINDQRCNQVFLYEKSKMYCALDKNNNKNNNKNNHSTMSSNVCFGDSGGPLMYMKDGRWHLYGITSMVILNGTIFNRFCKANAPSFFTSVPAYLDFIGHAIENLRK